MTLLQKLKETFLPSLLRSLLGVIIFGTILIVLQFFFPNPQLNEFVPQLTIGYGVGTFIYQMFKECNDVQ